MHAVQPSLALTWRAMNVVRAVQEMMERYNAMRLAVEMANDRQERITYQQLARRVLRQVGQPGTAW